MKALTVGGWIILSLAWSPVRAGEIDKEAVDICLTGATKGRSAYERMAASLPDKEPLTVAQSVLDFAKTRGWGAPKNDPRKTAFLAIFGAVAMSDVAPGPEGNRLLLAVCARWLAEYYQAKLGEQ